MKPFDLEAAKAGQPVCTRHGQKVRFACFDMANKFPIVALINMTGQEDVYVYSVSGDVPYADKDSCMTLFMAPRKEKRWIATWRLSGALMCTCPHKDRASLDQQAIPGESYELHEIEVTLP